MVADPLRIRSSNGVDGCKILQIPNGGANYSVRVPIRSSRSTYLQCVEGFYWTQQEDTLAMFLTEFVLCGSGWVELRLGSGVKLPSGGDVAMYVEYVSRTSVRVLVTERRGIWACFSETSVRCRLKWNLKAAVTYSSFIVYSYNVLTLQILTKVISDENISVSARNLKNLENGKKTRKFEKK